VTALPRRNGGMLYLQIGTAMVLGIGAVLLGVLAPPPNGLGWLVILIGGVMILAGLGGAVYAFARTRGGTR